MLKGKAVLEFNSNHFATAPTKCNTKDTLCDDSYDTCLKMFKTLGMSAIHVYMIRTNHQKCYPLRQTKIVLYTMRDTSHARRQHM